MKYLSLAIIGAALLLATALPQNAHSAGIYRWVDSNGKVHYSDKSVFNSRRVRSTDLSGRTIPPKPQIPVPVEYAEEVKRQCALHKSRLESFQAATDITYRDPSGNQIPLNATQQKIEIERTKQEVRTFCGNAAPERLWNAGLTAHAKK